MLNGRAEILADCKEVSPKNIIDVLRETLPKHRANASDMDFLLGFEAGNQPLGRTKLFRPEIDCICVDNVASEVTDFKLGYFWGNPISLVGRGEAGAETEGVALLNRCYDASGHRQKTQKNARYIEICGIGYTYIDINMDYKEGDGYFTKDVLDPRSTYVVRSSLFPDHRIILAVTYRADSNGALHFTCFTPEKRFEIVSIDSLGGQWSVGERNDEPNPLHMIPIIEWHRSYDRMGCFEKHISNMTDLNVLASDYTNSVEQNTNSIWWTNDVELKATIRDADGSTRVVDVTPKSGQWVHTFTNKDGRTPIIQPLTSDYNYSGMLENYLAKRALILQKCKVPQRNDNSGGSTGIAMSDATGWSAAETDACMEQLIVEGCMIEEVRAALSAIRESPFIKPDSPLLRLKCSDMQVNMKRQKTYELTTKVNAIATLISHGFSIEDCVSSIPLFDDPSQVISRSGDGVRKYQEASLGTDAAGPGDVEVEPDSGRTLGDYSDQRANSPMMS